MFKRYALVVVLLCLVSTAGLSQGPFDFFFHPRPVPHGQNYAVIERLGTTDPLWLFKPSFSVAAMTFRGSEVSGKKVDTGFLSGVGPALTFQHSIVQDGLNYADYSASLALLLTGDTQNVPTFEPSIALVAGALNNLFEIGVGYDLVQVAGRDRFFVILSCGLNIVNN